MVGRVTQACLAGMGTCLLFLAEADACICSTQHPASSIHSSVRSRLAAGCSGTHPTHSAAPEWGIGRGRDLDPHSPQQHGAHNSWLRNAELSTARQPQHSTRSTLGRRRRMHHLRTTHQHTRSDSYPVVWLTPIDFDITRNSYAHASPPIDPFLSRSWIPARRAPPTLRAITAPAILPPPSDKNLPWLRSSRSSRRPRLTVARLPKTPIRSGHPPVSRRYLRSTTQNRGFGRA